MRNAFGAAGLPLARNSQGAELMDKQNLRERLPDQKNKEMAKSDDMSLKTKQEGEPDREGVVGGSGGGSSDGTGSA
jgi:hypothetical protein